MRTNIKKEQAHELRQVLTQFRLPAPVVDALVCSQEASNTYKAFRQQKKITTQDGWTIHFGKKQANHPVHKPTVSDTQRKRLQNQQIEQTSLESLDELTPLERFAQQLGTSQPEVSKGLLKVSLDIEKDKLLRIKAIAVKKQNSIGDVIRAAIDNYLDQLE